MTGALVLILDGLGTGWLGPYGNTWIDTPALCHLAARSHVVEFMVTDSARPEAVFESIFSGRHVACRQDAAANAHRLLPAALPAGTSSVLLTDQPGFVRPGGLASGFQQAIVCRDTGSAPADSPADTALAQLFSEAARLLEVLQPPYLLCVYGQVLTGSWDAPYALRASLADPDDPAPPELVAPPRGPLEAVDPDQLWGLRCAAGGQVLLLDGCLAALIEQIEGLPEDRQPLIVLTAPRGFPIGEHGVVGGEASGLFAELVAVPLIIAPPAKGAEGARHPLLAQPHCVGPLLADWLHTPLPWEVCMPPRDRADGQQPLWPTRLAVTVGQGQLRLQTAQWAGRLPGSDGQPPLELYAKPDDRWEINNVAALCPDAVAELEQTAAECRRDGWHRWHGQRSESVSR